MTKLRLPKPAAGNVVSRHLYLGSVYTTEQMRKFAEKSVLVEREKCAAIAEEWLGPTKDRELHIAAAIRARGQHEGD